MNLAEIHKAAFDDLATFITLEMKDQKRLLGRNYRSDKYILTGLVNAKNALHAGRDNETFFRHFEEYELGYADQPDQDK